MKAAALLIAATWLGFLLTTPELTQADFAAIADNRARIDSGGTRR